MTGPEKPVRGLTVPNTQVSVNVRTVCSQTLITKILGVMDGRPKVRSDIMKCEQYLMCRDKISNPSVYGIYSVL